jgi:hypothetical protein
MESQQKARGDGSGGPRRPGGQVEEQGAGLRTRKKTCFRVCDCGNLQKSRQDGISTEFRGGRPRIQHSRPQPNIDTGATSLRTQLEGREVRTTGHNQENAVLGSRRICKNGWLNFELAASIHVGSIPKSPFRVFSSAYCGGFHLSTGLPCIGSLVIAGFSRLLIGLDTARSKNVCMNRSKSVGRW